MKKPGFWKNPKWRYGGYSFAAFFLFLGALVLANLGFSELETKYGWRKDFSFNNLTTQSGTTRSVLKALTHPVHIYAVYTKGQEDAALMELLNRYQTASPLVTYEELDLAKNPGLLQKFQGDADGSVTDGSLIVSCEATGRYKILTSDSFATVGYDIDSGSYGVEVIYEKQVTEALLYVTKEEIPEIMLLTGHSELEGDDVLSLTQALVSNNYQVRTVDLRSGDTLDPGALLMILAPRKDFAEDELAAVTSFLEAGGAMFITCDYTDDLTDMPNYLALLRAYGFKPLDGVVVASTEESGTYMGSTPIYLTPYMLSTPATEALKSAGMDGLILAGARAFETPETDISGLSVATVLASGYKAYLRDATGDEISLAQQDGDPIGPFSLALLSTRTYDTGTQSKAFILGNSLLATNSQLYGLSYNLEFLLKICEYTLNQAPISLDIIAKPYLRPGLKETGRWLGITAAAALPVLILVLALAVLLPRRHR